MTEEANNIIFENRDIKIIRNNATRKGYEVFFKTTENKPLKIENGLMADLVISALLNQILELREELFTEKEINKDCEIEYRRLTTQYNNIIKETKQGQING